MNLALVQQTAIVPHKNRAERLNHVELVVELVTFVFIEKVDYLNCYCNTRRLVYAGSHRATVATT